MEFQRKETYDLADLRQIVEILRAPGGCPWDREQTHHSIRNNFIEETYEAVEAIDREDAPLLQEELGDVLFQVLFHSQLEAEAGRFTFDDVVDGIAKKMIERHPHVFGEEVASNTQEVLRNWDAIKQQTKHQKTQTEVLQSVSPALPALMRASKVQQKAQKAGFPEEPNGGSAALSPEEAGRLLWQAVRAVRQAGLSAEQMLSEETDRYIARFAAWEATQTPHGCGEKV